MTYAAQPRNVAFRNRDGSLVLVAANPRGEARPFLVAWPGILLQAQLPPHAVATWRWTP